VVPVHDHHVVAQDVGAVQRQVGERRALARLARAHDPERPPVDRERARVDALAALPAVDHRRRGREVGVHELVRAHRVRHAVQHRPRTTIDDDLPAAAQAQLGALVVHVLLLGRRVPDLGRNRVLRRVGGDVDEQIRGAVEAAQPYPVGTEGDVRRVYKPFRGLAVWPGVKSLYTAYSQDSSIRRKVRLHDQ